MKQFSVTNKKSWDNSHIRKTKYFLNWHNKQCNSIWICQNKLKLTVILKCNPQLPTLQLRIQFSSVLMCTKTENNHKNNENFSHINGPIRLPHLAISTTTQFIPPLLPVIPNLPYPLSLLFPIRAIHTTSTSPTTHLYFLDIRSLTIISMFMFLLHTSVLTLLCYHVVLFYLRICCLSFHYTHQRSYYFPHLSMLFSFLHLYVCIGSNQNISFYWPITSFVYSAWFHTVSPILPSLYLIFKFSYVTFSPLENHSFSFLHISFSTSTSYKWF